MKTKNERFLEKTLSYFILGLALLQVFRLIEPTLNEGILSGWDSRGHLLKAHYWAHVLFKNGFWQGWFPFWHGGVPLNTVYPPLFTVILGISTLFLNPNFALNIGAALLMTLFVPVMYKCLRSFGINRISSATAAPLILLVDSPYTAGITAIYQVGLLPNAWGFLLTLILISRLKRDFSNQARPQWKSVITGMLLATLILSHVFSTYWFFLPGLFLILTEIRGAHQGWAQILTRFFTTLIVGLALSAFWWIPFILNYSNMNKIEPMVAYSTLETMIRLIGLKEGGGLPMLVLAVTGMAVMWFKKEKKTFFFLFWVTFITFNVTMNTFNTLLPFGETVGSSQRIRFEGFFLWGMAMAAAYAFVGLDAWARQFRRLRFPVMLAAAIAVQGLIIYPQLSSRQLVPQTLPAIKTPSLPKLAHFLDERLKPGEFILSELNWANQGFFGTPHFFNQNLPFLSHKIWDLSGNLPEGTKGSEKPKILAQQMQQDYLQNNIPYLKERGVRYLVTAHPDTYDYLASKTQLLKPVWDSRKLSIQPPDTPDTRRPRMAVFELTDFDSPFGLPREAARRLTDVVFSPSGQYEILFSEPVKLSSGTTLALSYHPWLKVKAGGRIIPTMKNPEHLLAIKAPITNEQKIKVTFSPPPIVSLAKFFSIFFLAFLIFISARTTLLNKCMRLMRKPIENMEFSFRFIFAIPASPTHAEPPTTMRRAIWFGVAVLFMLFAMSRFIHLPDRPMHNDEGVNAWFLQNLVQSNHYKYDPENYHGPSLYYIQLIPTWISSLAALGFKNFEWSSAAGITETSVRVAVAAAGMLVLLGLLAARKRIGTWGAISAFILAGLSPDLLFYSRYFIHEIFVVLFTLGIYLASVYYMETRNKVYFYLACASASLLFCTKETSALIFIIFALAYDLSHLTRYIFIGKKELSPYRQIPARLKATWHDLGFHLLGGLAVALALWFLLFSSFGKNLKGPTDSFLAYAFWTGTGVESGHNKHFLYFISEMLCRYEAPLVFLSLLGLLIAFASRDWHGLFLSFWTMGIIAAHSIIPYKTPWLIINLILPMFLLSGYGIQHLLNALHSGVNDPKFKRLLLVILIVVLVLLARQLPTTWRMSYIDYDNEQYQQIYVHTNRDVFRMIADIDDATAGIPDRENIRMNIYCPVQWPMPFYLRHYKRTAWWGESASPEEAPFIIIQDNQEEALKKVLTKKYKVKQYTLRSGVEVKVYIDDDFLKNKRIEAADSAKPQ